MNHLESALLDELIDAANPNLLIRSNTRIDAGRWWRRTPVWICITSNELILFAVARRQYVERVPLSQCNTSHYAHTTGELVIDPADSLRIKHLALTPKQALDVLDYLKP